MLPLSIFMLKWNFVTIFCCRNMNQFSQPGYKCRISSNNYYRLHQVRIIITLRKSLNMGLNIFFQWKYCLTFFLFSPFFFFFFTWVLFLLKWPWKVGWVFEAWDAHTTTCLKQMLWNFYPVWDIYLYIGIFSLQGYNSDSHMQKCLKWPVWDTPVKPTGSCVLKDLALWEQFVCNGMEQKG